MKPKTKTETKSKPKSKTETKSTTLYTNDNPKTTIKGLGFKDKDTAIKSIKILNDPKLKLTEREKWLRIHTLYYRAKYHPHITNDIKEAMKVFKKWLDNYKKNKLSKSN